MSNSVDSLDVSADISAAPPPLPPQENSHVGGIDGYLQQVAALHQQMRAATTSVSRVREVTKHLVPVSLRLPARLAVTRALHRREQRRARQWTDAPLLHLGSGGEPKAGWVNIDLAGEPVDLAWDLSRALPFDSDVAGGAFHEHTLEHLSLAVGLALTRECFRVLKAGASLRIGVPDAGLLLTSYAGDGAALENLAPGRPFRLLAVQETFYWHHHVTMYDEDLLVALMREAGFVDVRRRSANDTDLPVDPDTEARREGTLYVEGVKPR